MTISIICTNKNPEPWYLALKEIDPSLDIQIWPDENNKSVIEFALCWKQPEGILQDYPNLKCICSMGAGIDHLLSDSFFPKNLPVIRLIDPSLAQSMFEYIYTAAMYYLREFDLYQRQKNQIIWEQHQPKAISQTTIGIMGLGKLGEYCARKLSQAGFNIVGWARTKKQIEDVKTYTSEQLEIFVSQTDILICLLPLTPQTVGILNSELFNITPKNSYLINVARGEHLVESDLITALNTGQLKGACLDVFTTEPLPQDHPFWTNDKIVITPHCSSITDPVSVAPQIVQNYRLMQSCKPLMNEVDLQRGY